MFGYSEVSQHGKVRVDPPGSSDNSHTSVTESVGSRLRESVRIEPTGHGALIGQEIRISYDVCSLQARRARCSLACGGCDS
jgi:hypothetical protein